MIGTVLNDTYRLERLIGRGSMGTVYEAAHLRLRRHFAVKLLPPALSSTPSAMARFKREADLTSELGHPHIVDVVDFNQTADGQPYLVMELLEGEDLASRIRRQGPLDLDQVASVTREATSALQAMHEQGIIHRDIKPQNIFLAQGRAGETVKILDLGLSRMLDNTGTEWTHANQLLGSPGYMAPELAEGRAAEADARTDIYCFGAVLYAMLTGRPPFEGGSIPVVVYQAATAEPTPLEELRPDAPPALCEAVRRAMRKRPAERYASAAELAGAVAAALGVHEAVAAPSLHGSLPPAPAPRAPALAEAPTVADDSRLLDEDRRGRRMRFAAIGIMVAFAVGGSAYLLLARRAKSTITPPGRDTPARVARPVPPDLRLATNRLDLSGRPRDASTPSSPDRSPLATSHNVPKPARGSFSASSRGGRALRSPAVAQTGVLSVGTTGPDGVAPTADVYLDGKLVDQTPWRGPVPAGKHTVRVVRSGFKDFSTSVTVMPNQVKVVTAPMVVRPQ